MFRGISARVQLLLVVVLGLAAFAAVFIPAWLIQPFRMQTSSGVELSFLLRRWSPWLTLLLLIPVIGISISLWRGGARRWQRVVAVPVCLLALLAAWFSRQNHFEWMFGPLHGPAYAHAANADFMEASDMVLAVKVNGDSAAYPVRQLAYHHLVQDVVGGLPEVATY